MYMRCNIWYIQNLCWLEKKLWEFEISNLVFKKLTLHCWDWTFEELRIYFQDFVVHSKFLRRFVTDHSIGFPSHLLILWVRLSFFTEIKQTTTPCMPITMAHCDFVPWKTIKYTWLLASVRYIAHSQQLDIPLTEIVEILLGIIAIMYHVILRIISILLRVQWHQAQWPSFKFVCTNAGTLNGNVNRSMNMILKSIDHLIDN